MCIRDSEFRLAHPTKPVHRRHDTDRAGAGQHVAQRAKFSGASDKSGVVPNQIPRRSLRQPSFSNGVTYRTAQRSNTIADQLLLQRLNAAAEPRRQILELQPRYVRPQPGRWLVVVDIHGSDRHEEHPGDRIRTRSLCGVLMEFVPLPPAVRAAQIVRRDTDQQNARRPQPGQQSKLPVLACLDFRAVEEDPDIG